MRIHFRCECGKVLKAREGMEGQQGRCPACGREFTIPAESDAEFREIESVAAAPAPPPRAPEAAAPPPPAPAAPPPAPRPAAPPPPPAPAPPPPAPKPPAPPPPAPAPPPPAPAAPPPRPAPPSPPAAPEGGPTCDACGQPVAPNAAYCGKCGFSLRPRAAAAPVAPPPPTPAAPPPPAMSRPAAPPPSPPAPQAPPAAAWPPAPPSAPPPRPSAPPAPAPYAPAPSPYAAPRPAAPSPQPAPWQAAPSGYAAAPDETQGARTLGILFLGILLVLACVLPMMMPAMGKVEVMFTNFTLLGEEQVRFVGKLLLLLPGIAGIAAIVLAFAVRNVVRSIILLGLGIAAFVLPLFDETAGRLPGIVAFTGPGSGIGLVCMFAGAAVLYAGCRSRCFRPWSLAAAIVGAIGGAIYVASLVLPQTAGADIEIVRQFKMLERQTMVEGIVQLVVTVLALLACVLCFINIPLAPKGRKLGVAAFWLLLVSMLLCYYGMILVPGLQGGDIPGELILPLIVVTLKTGSFILGTVLLVGVGLADLIVNLSRGGAPAAAAGGPPLYSTPGASPYGAPAPYAPPSPYAAPSPYGGAPAAPPQDDTSARLQRLNDAYARGLISPAEYERKKNEILSRM